MRELDSGAKAFGLLLHARHQFIAVHAFRKAGIIFDDAGGGEQAAGLVAGKDERLQDWRARCKARPSIPRNPSR